MLTAHIEASHRVRTPISTLRPTNKILASLPTADYERIAPQLKRVPMKIETLYRQDTPIDGVFFPGGGACALVKTTLDGQTAEIASVGAEGVIGASVFFGLSTAPCDVLVQLAGPHADIMPTHLFRNEMDSRGALYNRIVRYSQALMMQVMQSTVCNGLHSVEKRCARWLLETQDRAENDEFRLTHEYVAAMLGVRRPTVTLAAHSLEAAGLIHHRRGIVTIVDRGGLEATACECYQTIRSTFSRLLPELSPGAQLS